jgi:hypothetical protein
MQIETSSGDVHHLIAENQQQQTEWVSRCELPPASDLNAFQLS